MKLDIRYANHPDDSKKYDTTELREKYLIEKVFEADDILLTYSHQDRIIAGGIMPVKKALKLETSKELAAKYFLERRNFLKFTVNVCGVRSKFFREILQIRIRTTYETQRNLL